MLEPRLIAVSLGLALGIVVSLGVGGPLGTDDDFGLFIRTAYWGSCAVVCWPICHALDTLVLYFTRSCRPTMIVLLTTACALFMAIPCAAIAYVLRGLFGTGIATAPTVAQTYLVAAVVLVPALFLVHYVACQRARLRGTTTPAMRADAVYPRPTTVPPPPASTAVQADDRQRMAAAGSTVSESLPFRRDREGGTAARNDRIRAAPVSQPARPVADGPADQDHRAPRARVRRHPSRSPSLNDGFCATFRPR